MAEEKLRTYLVTYFDEDSHERTTIQQSEGVEVTDHGDLLFFVNLPDSKPSHITAAFARGHWAAVTEK